MTRQVRIDNLDARFIEFLISIQGESETFATVIRDALRDKYPDLWEQFSSMLKERGEDVDE